jgi:hypothetical protein
VRLKKETPMDGAVGGGQRRTAGLLMVLAALATTGCTSARHVYFRPAGEYQGAGADWVAKRVYSLPPGSREVKVQIAARGKTDENDRGVTFDTLHVRLEIENGGQSAFTLDPATVRLLDDEGRAVEGAEAYAGRNRTGTITIAAGAGAAYDLVLDLPGSARLQDVGSLRLAWPYRYGDKAQQVTTKFIKIEQVNYYYPYHYPPYGYYDPWFYDPWYGPWGRRRSGFGYYHGW